MTDVVKDVPTPPVPETVGHDTDSREKVYVASYGGGGLHRGQNMSLSGLEPSEIEVMRGAMHGHSWVRCKDGRIQHVPSYEPLPDPVVDDMMLPFWRRPGANEEVQLNLFSFEPTPVWASPSITISHLCGYFYSASNYADQARKLMRWGFVCLRSQRDNSGEYYENWYLSGLWAAKEELRQAIDTMDPYILQRSTVSEFMRDTFGPPPNKRSLPKTRKGKQKKELETAVSFLGRNAQFGTLDVSIQRMAMGVPD